MQFHFCRCRLGTDDFCYGCQKFVCFDCDKLQPYGKGYDRVEDHQKRRAGVNYGVHYAPDVLRKSCNSKS